MKHLTGFLLCLCGVVLMIGASGIVQPVIAAQTEAVSSPMVITAMAVPATTAIAPQASAQYPYVLLLTVQDSGSTFSIPLNGLIVLQIPRFPFAELVYDPAILQPITYLGLLPPDRPMPVEGTVGPATESGGPNVAPGGIGGGSGDDTSGMMVNEWRLVAIRPGVSPISLRNRPCQTPPCPKPPSGGVMPAFQFEVTIIVQDIVYPPPPQPIPPYTGRTDVYIGTAYLNQEVSVRPGQVVTLDLPSLVASQTVRLRFDYNILQPLPGQDLRHPQRGGWHFQVKAEGTTPIIVSADPCTDLKADCSAPTLFQVIIRSGG